jgi:hypothetical protein
MSCAFLIDGAFGGLDRSRIGEANPQVQTFHYMMGRWNICVAHPGMKIKIMFDRLNKPLVQPSRNQY